MSTYAIPNVVAQSPRGDRVLDVYSHLLAERIVYLGTEIDAGVANVLIAQLLHLDAVGTDREIQLYVNGSGGDPQAALAVYDTMRFVRSPIATTCVGQAVGPAAVLLAAGAPGRRAALPHARVVLHQPATSARGTVPDLILEADELARVRGDLEEILAAHTGRDAATLRHDTERDRVLTAGQAVAYGVLDRVVERQPAGSAAQAASASTVLPPA